MRLKDKLHSSFKAIVSAAVVTAAVTASVFPVQATASPVAMADTLYSKGEYSHAPEAYLAIAQLDGDSPELLFNIANSYAQAGSTGNAILYYSRANRLDPTNKEIKNNLDYFSSKVEDSNRAELRGKKTSVAPDHDTFFQSVRRFI
ncbi:MAG: tetratricopeptide repeat protein, partial [Muribaculaceae bacterium]|nr:tetratricopeptide repeat protein [Muribaculaceae bacterium]